MEKRAPKVKILIFPSGDINRVAGNGSGDAFVVQDVFSGYLVQQQGEGAAGDGGAADNTRNGFDALQWQGQKAFDGITDTMEFVRFLKDGHVLRGVPGITSNEGIGGWSLRPISAPIQCRVTPPRANDPQPPGDDQVVTWRAVKGADWESYVPAEPPYKSCIRHRSQQPDKALEIVSQPLDAPHGVEVELVWDGVFAGQTKDPGVRLILIDKKLSVVWRRIGKSICYPTVERFRNRETGSGWEVWKNLGDAAPVTFQGRTLVRLRIVGGIYVLDLDDKSYYLVETRTLAAADEPPEAAFAVWPRAAMRLSVYGVDVALGASLLSLPESGGLARTVSAPFSRSTTAQASVNGFTGGHKPPGTSVFLGGVREANAVTYELALLSDKKRRVAPFVTNACIAFDGAAAGASSEPVDLRSAAASLQYSSGEPDLLPTSEVQIELSRTLLDAHVPNWQDFIVPFAPIRVLATWDYDDGGAITEGSWTRVFEGHIITPDKALPDYNEQNLTVVARDPTVRLKDPAGFVDERYAPLDFLFMSGDGSPLYDGDCVKYLLQTELGARLANTINGNGDALYFSDANSPLLSMDNDRVGYFMVPGVTGAATQGTFHLPPPFGRDVFSWIHDDIAQATDGVFFWGFSPLAATDSDPYGFDTSPLVPIYGRLNLIMAALGATPKVLPDAIYLGGDANDLIASATVENLTDKFYNEVVVWGGKPEGIAEGLTPSFFGGRARLAPDEANAAEHSWRRVMLEQQDFIGKIAGSDYAQGLATLLLREFEGTAPRTVTVVMPRGDETVRWGQKIMPQMQASGSDLTLGINGETFRVKRVTHTFDFTGSSPDRAFVTELVCRSLSASGF